MLSPHFHERVDLMSEQTANAIVVNGEAITAYQVELMAIDAEIYRDEIQGLRNLNKRQAGQISELIARLNFANFTKAEALSEVLALRETVFQLCEAIEHNAEPTEN